MKTYKLTWQTMDGRIKTSRFRARTHSEAVDILCGEHTVANLLAVWCGGVQVV